MGWTKRSSGNRYDSQTGHAVLFGQSTKKIIGSKIYNKGCQICANSSSNGNVTKSHRCLINWEESSKAMESAAILEFCTNAPAQNYYIKTIICDDDNNMRKHLKHKTDQNRKGKLSTEVPEPVFLADPTHRVKTIAKYFFQLAQKPLYQSPVTKDLALKMKQYFGYMLKQQRYNTLDEIRHASKAPLQHLFNDHNYCETSWCLAKRAKEQGLNYINRESPFLDLKEKKG